MALVKLTKNELRHQQYKLGQLEKYLPTLQLKKAMLQSEVNGAQMEIEDLSTLYQEKKKKAEHFQKLLSSRGLTPFFDALHVEEVKIAIENIAGIEIPIFKGVIFSEPNFFLIDTPLWWDAALLVLRRLIESKERLFIAIEKKKILEKELHEVSIRVNLFEKILIPRTLFNIKKIRVFLGDQELAAVSQAKVAKVKIEKRKMAHEVAHDL